MGILALLILWQILSTTQIVPEYLLPSPMSVLGALGKERELLWQHAKVTLLEAFLGLFFGTILGFLVATVMDRYAWVYRVLYPLLVMSQTVPTIAIAPLLVLWFGFGMMPKVLLIVLTTFFPIAVGLFDSFSDADPDAIRLLRSMGASRWQIFRHIKLPGSIHAFFAAFKISASYSIVGAVISEWLGGFEGLGVYMTRVIKSYSFDKMFAVIFLISFISLLLIGLVNLLHRFATPWEKRQGKERP